jgi:hypothetical protein
MNSRKAQVFWTSFVTLTVALLALYQTFAQGSPSPSSSLSEQDSISNRIPSSDKVGAIPWPNTGS